MVYKIPLGLINLDATIYIFPDTGSMRKYAAEMKGLNLSILLSKITEKEL